MSYTENYENMTDAEKFFQAITDTQGYLGLDRFNAIVEVMRKEKTSFRQFSKAIGYAVESILSYPVRPMCIQGYSLKAMYQYTFGFDAEFEPLVSICKKCFLTLTIENQYIGYCSNCQSDLIEAFTHSNIHRIQERDAQLLADRFNNRVGRREGWGLYLGTEKRETRADVEKHKALEDAYRQREAEKWLEEEA